MSNSKISIIVPVYNGEHYINRLFNCINIQTYQNFEVLFIDDGSTDQSSEILKSICDNKKYFYFRQSNKGVSAARNLGIKESTGNYICFIDVDDGISECFLEYLLNRVDGANDKIAFCDLTDRKVSVNETQVCTVNYSKDEALLSFLYGQISIGVCGMIIPKKILLENSLQFKEGYKYSEDLHMVWRVLNFSNSIIHLKEPLYVYYKNEGSAMTKINESRLDSVYLMENLEEFFLINNKKFYPIFKKFAVAKIKWSILWQTAYYLNLKDFISFSKKYDFSDDMRKLSTFPSMKVKLSSKIFIFNKYLYYYLVKIVKCRYRK